MITAIFYNCRYEVAAEEYKEAVKTLMNVDEDKENMEDKVQKITGILSKQTLDSGDKMPVTPVAKMNFFVNEVIFCNPLLFDTFEIQYF